MISTEELAKHNSPDDLWVAIDGRVYDLTRYQDEHPGSDTVLQNVAGRDATGEFYGVSHSDLAFAEMKPYQIGLLSKDGAERMICNDPHVYDHTDMGHRNN